MMFRRRNRRRFHEIAPDEIFLDAENLPAFNQDRMEGRLERPLPSGTYIALASFIGLMFFALIAQAANLELIKGESFAARSENNRVRPSVIFAERGAILDRNGVPLVKNEEGEKGFVQRVYQNPGFAHLLGYVSYPKKDSKGFYYDTDIKGLAGVEGTMNERLAGENGTLLIEEDARGEVQSQGTVEPAKNGQDVTLAIDARVQTAFYNAISELADRIPFEGGSGILMDVETGEVHALVSYPEYDPNVLSSGGPSETISGYLNDKRQPYLDRAVGGLYTPGSIIKPIEAAGALTDGIITPETIIPSNGFISIPNRFNPDKPTIFRDWKNHGAVDVRTAIAVSSDVFFYTVGGGYGGMKGLGIERLAHWYETFGLTSPTNINLDGETTGFVPTPKWKMDTYGEDWSIGNTYHTSIGQYAMQITPIEAARAIAAVANGGKLIQPNILKGQSVIGQTIDVDPYALQVAREGMRMGATEGTSIGLNNLSFVKLAGKTGTAQLGVNNEFYNSWIVGFFPYEKPKYVYVVVMERGPSTNSIGGVYVMHKVLSEMHRTAPEYFE